MIKIILVCTDGSANGTTACEYAIELSKCLKARLSALHVLDSRMLEGPLMADISGWVGAQPFGAQLQQFRDLMEAKGDAVIAGFNQLCEERGVEAEGWVKMGHPVRVILEEEARAELVVLGRQGEHAEWAGELPGSTIERVVRHTIKPCLITPVTFSPIRKILAAYDGSGHASRALHEAIELALALAVPLVILTVCEDGELERARGIAEDGLKLARAHECPAANLVVEGLPDDAILQQAEELGCDLLVVGAFGHARIRQMILGSTTTQLIARTSKPLMLVR